MKTYFTVFLGLMITGTALGEVWEKPRYQPDENHLKEEIQKEEENLQRSKRKTKQGFRENQEEASTPRDYTSGKDSPTPAKVRRSKVK